MDPQLYNKIMEEKDDNDDDNHNKENARQRHASAEAAGIVRGVSRSIARSIGTSRNLSKTLSKQVPKITKQFFTRRGQLRVSGVAKVSDRISTGWEVYSSVKETVEEGNVPKKKTRNRSWVPVWNTLRTFTASELFVAS